MAWTVVEGQTYVLAGNRSLMDATQRTRPAKPAAEAKNRSRGLAGTSTPLAIIRAFPAAN